MRTIHDFTRMGLLPQYLARCTPPKCMDCFLGKQPRRQKLTSTTINNKQNPGDMVHCDQLISAHPGIKFTGNKSSPFHVVNLFVDSASRLPLMYCARTTSAEECVLAKSAFELFASQHGVRIKHYHADNGVYDSHLWKRHCAAQKQSYSFCGVSAHHQNPIAENMNRRATEMARTALMTVSIHCSERHKLQDFNLQYYWPFSVYHHIQLLAEILINGQELTPMDLFSNSKSMNHLSDCHVWGCSIYVLEPRLADGKTILRWKQRSRRGLYLVKSPNHASNVALVLNLTTRRISAQYHVVFDDQFHTVAASTDLEKLWPTRYAQNRELNIDPYDIRRGKHPNFDWDHHPATPILDTRRHTADPSNNIHNLQTSCPHLPTRRISSAHHQILIQRSVLHLRQTIYLPIMQQKWRLQFDLRLHHNHHSKLLRFHLNLHLKYQFLRLAHHFSQHYPLHVPR